MHSERKLPTLYFMLAEKQVVAQTPERLKPVKSILITQSFKPEQQTPYQEIEKKF
ncbi:MAG: hypothetical protein RIR51_1544, partial [Bacteroidota bacterium]